MSTRKHKLTADDLRKAFSEASGLQIPPILSPKQFGHLVGISSKTIYEWHAKGRLAGATRKRGKHLLIWRDRAIDILFNGREWQ